MSDRGEALFVSLFGPLGLAVGGVPVALKLAGPPLELLSYLLCYPGRELSRESIADALWHEADPDKVRGALNTVLWRLRKALKPVPALSIVASRDAIHLDLGSGVTIDSLALAAAAARARQDGRPVLDPCHRAGLAEIVAGCDGRYIDNAHGDWVLAERERQFDLLMDALMLLMNDAAARRDYAGGLAYGRRILAADPFREKVHCQVMWLYVLDGQRPRAIKHYLSYRQQLRRELAIDPMPETAAVSEYIAKGGVQESCDTALRTLFDSIDLSRRAVMQALSAMAEA